jgi:hypothetical protein
MTTACLAETSISDPTTPESAPAVPGRLLAAVAVAMLSVWTAAGSIGLVAYPLRNALIWMGLLALTIVLWPQRRPSWRELAGLAAAILFTLAAGAWMPPEISVLAMATVLAVLARWHEASPCGGVLRLLAQAAAMLGLYRLACVTIPAVWQLADLVGRGLGHLAGYLGGQPLWLGATFSGLDFLVFMAVLYGGWLRASSAPRMSRALYGAVAIVVGHFVYLLCLDHCTEFAALLPLAPPAPPSSGLEQTPTWAWGDAVRTLLPWNLPVLAAVIQAGVAMGMFRWGWSAPAELNEAATGPHLQPLSRERARGFAIGTIVLALLIPAVLLLCPFRANLSGKTIVADELGYVNWDRPVHDHFGERSAGMLGMLPRLIESLGGKFVVSHDLAEKDLAQADVLLLVHPNREWTPELRDRVWNYVRQGGSLLLAAESRQFQDGQASTFNEILQPTAIRVRYDTLVSETVNWRQALETSAFAAAAGVGDCRDRLGFWSGASLMASWPARPGVVGRWGFADPGSDTAIGARGQYDPGEKLGDLILVAHQRLGDGTVAVLGDTSPLANQVSVASYLFTGRLFGYLAGHISGPQAWWRQLLGLAALVALAVALMRWADMLRLATAAAVLGLATGAFLAVNTWASDVLPDGRGTQPNKLAYIDSSHLEAHCGVSWSDMGINGLGLTLMRDGYLPLLAPDLTPARLERAGLLISIAPARPFSATERQTLRQWLEAGGIFLITVGAEDEQPSRELLAEYGFRVPHSPVPWNDSAREPAPLGCLFALYHGSARVLLDAGWAVESSQPDAVPLLFDRPGEGPQVAGFSRTVGKGRFVVIGDSRFPLNRNLERADGQMVHNGYYNAYFWRWLLPQLNGQPAWSPPPEASKLPASVRQPDDLSTSEVAP